MRPPHPEWITDLLVALTETMEKECGIQPAELSTLLNETQLLQHLAQTELTRYNICSEVLTACQPAMDRLFPTPPEG